MDELKCTKVIRIDLGKDHQGKPCFEHKKCGLPASEYDLSGHSFTAKAVLCGRHKAAADREIAQSLIPKKFQGSKLDKAERAGQQRLIP